MISSRARRALALLGPLSLASPAWARLPGRPAVIVQDFRNRSYDIRHDWIGTGLAYLVRKNLSNLGSLEMLEDRRAKPEDAEPVADYVIEGEIRLDEGEARDSPKFIVFVTLDKTQESQSRRQFLTEGRSAQLFEMSGYLAERIARHVGVDLSEEVRQRFGRGMTQDLNAFQLFAEAMVDRRVHAKIEAYEKAVTLDPRFAEAYFHLARVQTVLRNHVQAEAALRKTIELVPDFAAAHNDLAYVLAQQGKLGPAEAEYRVAVSADPEEPRFHLNLGDLLRQQGKAQAAQAEYETAMRLRPGDLEATAALQAMGVKPVATVAAATPVLAATPPPRVTPAATASASATPLSTPKPTPRPTPAPSIAASPKQPAATPPAAAARLTARDEQELASARECARRARGDKAAAEAAVGEAESALRTGERARAYLAIGRMYLGEKLNFAAVSALKTAVELDPARKEARLALADAYERVGKKKDAERERKAP